MDIPLDQLESTKMALGHLVDERTTWFGGYSDEERSTDDQDYEDIEKIKTVYDVFRFLRDQGGRTVFVEYASCLDPLGGFKVAGKSDDEIDERDEEAFRAYLRNVYRIPKKEFP